MSYYLGLLCNRSYSCIPSSGVSRGTGIIDPLASHASNTVGWSLSTHCLGISLNHLNFMHNKGIPCDQVWMKKHVVYLSLCQYFSLGPCTNIFRGSCRDKNWQSPSIRGCINNPKGCRRVKPRSHATPLLGDAILVSNSASHNRMERVL